MPYSAGVHPIAIGKSVQKTGLPYNNSLYPNCPQNVSDMGLYQCVEGGRGDAWVVSSNHHPEALFLASAVARDTFLKLIRERLCGGEDVDSWYGFQRNISNDHS
jgi:hypothetical protein